MPSTAVNPVDISELRFAAAIDYLTVFTGSKISLPPTGGEVKWPASKNWQAFTIHDPTPEDVADLLPCIHNSPLMEMEVRVDLSPAPGVASTRRTTLLEAVMVEIFGMRLDPSAAPFMAESPRNVYRRYGSRGSVQPVSFRLPHPSDQQLHGWRGDPAQVKAYLKRRDAGKELPAHLSVARVEVRLGRQALIHHDILCITDLIGFKFRRALMPYFRHVDYPAIRRSKKEGALLHVLRDKRQEIANREWAKSGMGAIVKGGKCSDIRLRLARCPEINNRIGQALHRLERSFQNSKFVCNGVDQVL